MWFHRTNGFLSGVCSLVVATVGWLTVPGCADNVSPEEPPLVTPGSAGRPPSDALVLFGGNDASNFTDLEGNPAPWQVVDGLLIAGDASIVSKQQFSDAQLHVEFNLPVGGDGYGNSGLYLHKIYEVQIIDSFNDNPFRPGQQCAALYKTFVPTANVCRAPGQWQTYDIIFHGAKLDDEGNVRVPARITVFHNGVLVQYNRSLKAGTGGGGKRYPMVSEGPLLIQAHRSPVKFRNLWLRQIPPLSAATAGPLNQTDLEQPAPRITPGAPATDDCSGTPPGDAVVLFDGTNMNGWVNSRDPTKPATWKIADGAMVVGGGHIVSAVTFEDVQLHVEWAAPAKVRGDGQGRGNSGLKFHRRSELQVLDSYHNRTYTTGQAGAIYGQHAPQVNASRPPGQWQTYDIVWRAAKFNEQGRRVDHGSFTVLHNGVLVQDHVLNRRVPRKPPAAGRVIGPLLIQDHGSPVRYRNIWLRRLTPHVVSEPRVPPTFHVLQGDHGMFEAEDGQVTGAVVDNKHSGCTGGAYVDFQVSSGDSLTWPVKIAQAGTFELVFRYALDDGDRPLRLIVNGQVVERSLSFPASDDWNEWIETKASARLKAGLNTITLTSFGHGGSNLDHLEIRRLRQQ